MKVTQEMFICMFEERVIDPDTHKLKTNIRFSAHEYDMSGMDGWTMLDNQRHTVTFYVPDDVDFRACRVKAIKAEIEKTRADFQKRLTELQEQYNNLLAIEG